MPQSAKQEPKWAGIYKLGGVAALVAVLTGIIEIGIHFFPVRNAPHETVLDWFILFQDNPFMGLRNMGSIEYFPQHPGYPDLSGAVRGTPKKQ